MTTREQAEKILSATQYLRRDDALVFLEDELRAIFIKGEKAGLEAARQSISRIGPQEESHDLHH
jgi:hypothetical protein